MSPEQNKVKIQRYFQRIDEGDISVLDEYLSSDYIDHNPPPFPDLPGGFAGAKKAFQLALDAFSDFRHTIEDQVAEGDRVVTRITAMGRHTGTLLGLPATGKEITMTGIAIHRFENGRMAEHWGEINALGLLTQIGAIPPLGTEPRAATQIA